MKPYVTGMFVLGLVAGVVACSGSSSPPSVPPATKVIDIGPLQIERILGMQGSSGREKVDAHDVGWVTGFRAEILDPGSGQRLGEDFLSHSELTLDNDTRLLVAPAGVPEIRFPSGFGMPLGQILRDIPEAWRGASVLGSIADPSGASSRREAILRVTLEYLPTGPDKKTGLRRLYVLALPLVAQPHETRQQVLRKKYSYLVPLDSTVHYGIVHLHPPAKSMSLTDVTDSKVLWQVDVKQADPGQVARVPAYTSDTGFPLYREHEYEVEAKYDGAGGAPVDATAIMYLYYHPPGDEEFSYPYPPPEGGS